MDNPMHDPEVPQEVRTLLLAADGAANSGRWDRSRELVERAGRLTAELAKRTVPAENFMATLAANTDNKRLSDAGFREFVRNTLPIVIFPRVAARPSDTHVDQPAPEAKSELVREIRQRSLDLHRNRYMPVLDAFSLESFSAERLSEMPESRLRELLVEIIKESR